jgi:hypothetical protein
VAHCGDAGVAFAAIGAHWGGGSRRMDLQSLGTADLLNAFYRANHAGVLAGQLGATYFIPTVVVPLLLITHVTAFISSCVLSPRRFKPSLVKRWHLSSRDGKRRAKIT